MFSKTISVYDEFRTHKYLQIKIGLCARITLKRKGAYLAYISPGKTIELCHCNKCKKYFLTTSHTVNSKITIFCQSCTNYATLLGLIDTSAF